MSALSRLLLAGLLTSAAAAPAPAQSLIDRCLASTCVARLTPAQLLAEAEKLVLANRLDEARPMVAALGQIPAYRLESRFLAGLLASRSGDHRAAAEQYKRILSDDPTQTRVRFELANEFMAMGKTASADRQYRIVAQDRDLPPEISNTIRVVRDVIRSQRAWRLDVNFGLAPDTNINNATGNDQVTIMWGGTPVPLTLDPDAKARSGTGQFATISTGVRLPVSKGSSAILDLDAAGTNYSGTRYDDVSVQLAAGLDYRFSPETSANVQALAAQRWFGGDLLTRQLGARGGFQTTLSPRDRIGVQADVRYTDARFDRDYDGWQIGLNASYERAVSRTIIVSAGAFARRDALRADAYSSYELGGILGIGGELPFGVNFALSGTASRAIYDAPQPIFSPRPRRDWRFSGRATIGDRKIRVLGFSPQISVFWNRTDTTLDLYKVERTRVQLGLARYF